MNDNAKKNNDNVIHRKQQERLDEKGDLNTVQIILWGGIVLAVVLVFSVYFMMQSPLD